MPEEKDGLWIFIDPQNISSSKPEQGIYSFFLSADNELMIRQGENGNWKQENLSKAVLHVSKQINDGYIQEIGIPWRIMGGKPPDHTRLGFNISLVEKSNGSINYRETITSNDENAPYTWCPLYLEK